jgi:hypothetical protein
MLSDCNIDLGHDDGNQEAEESLTPNLQTSSRRLLTQHLGLPQKESPSVTVIQNWSSTFMSIGKGNPAHPAAAAPRPQCPGWLRPRRRIAC